jgi:hypothetical protein
MKKVIRLTESDLARIVKRVIKEQVFDQAAMNKMIAETTALASQYINTQTIKFKLKDGGVASLDEVSVGQGGQFGGIVVYVDLNVKDEDGSDFDLQYPIYSFGGGKKANYAGAADEATAKTKISANLFSRMNKYFITNGPEYTNSLNAITNGVIAITNKYNSTGVATK